jgi:hypothetical protein
MHHFQDLCAIGIRTINALAFYTSTRAIETIFPVTTSLVKQSDLQLLLHRDNFFQLFSSEKCFPKVAGQSEQVKNDHFERGCRWFQLFVIDFSYFIF